jgi:hypothetical protein
MEPKDVIEIWIKRFNAGDANGLANLYAVNAINDQVVFNKPLQGREEIKSMFELEFGRAEMVCIKENLLVAEDWVVLEWSDPLGLRGCGFFKIRSEHIIFQRGYYDQLSFFRIHGLPVPERYLDQ